MANSLREVKSRITSTKKTSQITKAMYMVSSSKVRRAQKTFESYQTYMKQFSNMVKTIVSKVDKSDFKHPMLNEREVKKTAYLLITSDNGLAGAYNSSVIKKFEETIHKNHKSKDEFVVSAVGRKGHGFIMSKQYPTLNKNQIFVRDDVMFTDILPLVTDLMESYNTKEVDKIVLVFNHFINSISQETTVQTLLPISEIDAEASEIDYLFEGGIESTLSSILPMYVQNVIFGVVLDAKTSEHSSRMTSMKSATDNANDVIGKLELIYNRARQATITNELIDIIGGANAIE